MNRLDTRKHIMKCALPLFAEHGFNGVSIRSIAKEADVNVAAVNYHFNKKETLYYEIVEHSYREIQAFIREMASKKTYKLEDFVVDTWKLFIDKGSMILNTFKIFISGGEAFTRICQSADFEGPPGIEIYIKLIQNEYPKVSEQNAKYFAHILHTNIVHSAIVIAGTRFHENEKIKDQEAVPKIEDCEGQLRMLSRMGLSYIKKS